MTRLYLLYTILLFACQNLASQNSPVGLRFYAFDEPNFAQLIPFSQDQLEIIKNKKIKKVEEIWQPNMEESEKTVYEFNKLGQLIGEYCFSEERGFLNIFKDQIVSIQSVTYSYDSAGYLVSRRQNGVHSRFDSIRYDSEHNIVYYNSYYHTISGGLLYEELTSFRLKDYYGDTLVLLDVSYPEDSIEYYYYNGELIRVVSSEYSTDSIVKIQIDSVNAIKEYWHRGWDVLVKHDYRLGKKEVYENGLLISSENKYLNRPNLDGIKESYYYNQKDQIIRLETEKRQVFTVYSSDGLVESKVHKLQNELYLTTFSYSYYPRL